MAQFNKTVSDIGVPDTTERGIVNNSSATLIQGLGNQAIAASRGYEDARLELALEEQVNQLAGEPRYDNAEKPTKAEEEYVKKTGTLQAGYANGQIGYSEFMARVNAETRRSINRMPGRANNFRAIRNGILGDNNEILKQAKSKYASSRSLSNYAAKQRLKHNIEAELAGMTPEEYTARKNWALTHTMRAEQEEKDIGKFAANRKVSFGARLSEIRLNVMNELGESLLSPQGVLEVKRRGLDELNQVKSEIDQWVSRTGNTDAAKKIREEFDTYYAEFLETIDLISQSKNAEEIVAGMMNTMRVGYMLTDPNSFYVAEKHPEINKFIIEATHEYGTALEGQEPGSNEYNRRLEILRRKWNGLLMSPFINEDIILNPLDMSDAFNTRIKQLREQGFTSLPKATHTLLTKSLPKTEEEHKKLADSVAAIADTSNGSGMELADLLDDRTFTAVMSSPLAQEAVKNSLTSIMNNFVTEYETDFKAINEGIKQGRAPSGLPFGPAYDMKYLSPLVAKADPGYQIYIPKGVGYAPITQEGVDDNYRKGIQLVGQIMDKYNKLYPEGGQTSMAKMVGAGIDYKEGRGTVWEQMRAAVHGIAPDTVGGSRSEIPVNEDLVVEDVPVEVINHIKDREGFSQSVYNDPVSNKPHVGTGHLILKNKTYIMEDGSKIKGKNLVIGDKLDLEFLNDLLNENTSDAYNAAQEQAEKLGIIEDDFVNALASVNYQLGTNWPSKWNNTWNKLMTGDIEGAIKVFKNSKWSRQTPVRVDDWVIALENVKDIYQEQRDLERVEPGHYFLDGKLVEIS